VFRCSFGSPVVSWGALSGCGKWGAGFYLHGKVPDSIVIWPKPGPFYSPPFLKGFPPAPDEMEADRSTSDCVRKGMGYGTMKSHERRMMAGPGLGRATNPL